MSEMMKQIVQEILQGNKTIVSKRTDQAVQKQSGEVPLQQIKRPNYQQLKRDKRLSAIEKKGPVMAGSHQNGSSVSTSRQTGNHGNKPSLPKTSFNEESISKLRSLSLAQGNVPKRNNASVRGNKRGKREARIIGQTRNGGCVWFFPDLPPELMGSFQRPLNRAGVGVMKMPESMPSHLLLVNEIIREHPDVKFNISWDKEGNAPFMAEFYGDDVDRLEKIMIEAYQKLNRRSLKPFEAYTAVSPGPWLTKQLNIGLSVDAVAFLEGIPYYSGIVLMDSLLKNFDAADIEFEIGGNHILLKGNYHVISNLVTELKKDAGRLTGTDKMMK